MEIDHIATRPKLTCKDGRHESCEHQEQHGEKHATGIEEHLAAILSNIHVQESNQNTDDHMRKQTKSSECLLEKEPIAALQEISTKTLSILLRYLG